MFQLKYRLPEIAALCCGAAALISSATLGNWVVAITACGVGAVILVCS